MDSRAGQGESWLLRNDRRSAIGNHAVINHRHNHHCYNEPSKENYAATFGDIHNIIRNDDHETRGCQQKILAIQSIHQQLAQLSQPRRTAKCVTSTQILLLLTPTKKTS